MTMTIPNLHDLANEREDRARWLAARQGVITATQAAAIAGSSPYTKAIDVWNERHDPDWQEERSPQLDMRAEFGRLNEPELIAWASTDEALETLPGSVGWHGDNEPRFRKAWTPNSYLVTSNATPGRACTPDAWKVVEGPKGKGTELWILDAKTSETDWIAKGVPQHIIDQMLWTWHVTGATRIFLAYAHTRWKGKVAEIVSRHLIEIPLDAAAKNRLRFLIERVEEFEEWERAGISPESDLDLRAVDFDTPTNVAQDYARLDGMLTELAEIRERVAADLKRAADLEEELKEAAKEYDGRRVYLIGTRMVVQMTRHYQADLDKSKLDPRDLAAATTWSERSRTSIVPNPEYSAPAESDTPKEN